MQTVYSFFVQEEITELPLDPFALIKKNKWGLVTYSKLANENGITVDEVINGFQSEDGYTIWDGENYTIAYNDTITSPERIRFTLMHEIGHIKLGHLTDFEETILRRSELTEEKYEVLEREAHAFARNSLAPAAVVNRIKANRPFFIINALMRYFRISYKAAVVRLEFLSWDSIKAIRYSYFFSKRFSDFIQNVVCRRWCPECNHVCINKTAKYCPVCGNDSLISSMGDEPEMIYSKIDLDELHRAVRCPKCDNEVVVGDYCQICGSYLVNRCTGVLYPNSDIVPHKLEKDDSACKEFLDGDARYCTQCGSVSTFYLSELLMDWQEERQSTSSNEAAATVDDPFTPSNVVNIGDDDLPF